MQSFRTTLRRLTSLSIATGVLLTAGSAAAASYLYDFSGPAPGTSFVVGDSLTPNGSTVEFKRFQWSSGTWTALGAATVFATDNAGGVADEMNLNNINMRIIPDTPSIYASYKYADFGGNVNLGVNGELRNTNDLVDVDGDVVGGCDISVSETALPWGVQGEVDIDCPAGTTIEKFGFGGQEFFVDDIFFED